MDLSILIWLAAILVPIVIYIRWSQTYWKRKRVYQIEPEFFFGISRKMIIGEASFSEQLREMYEHLKAKGLKYGGGYMFLSHFFIPVAPELTKQIMLKDFSHFMDHGLHVNEKLDPLGAHLFHLEGEKWKNLRVKLTPTFTSSKMKMMFQTFLDCTDGLVELIDSYRIQNQPVDTKEILARFTTDIIGSCAFGLECNSLRNPNAEFRKYGTKYFTPRPLRELLLFALPRKVLIFLRVRKVPKDIEEFFMNAVRDTINHREKNNVYRKDFLQLLIQLKNGQLENEENAKVSKPNVHRETFTMKELAAQCFVFFLAGFETSSTLMSFALFELALNPDIQEKVRVEINTVLKKHEGKLTYDAVMEMTYLEKVLNETLRKYPPVGAIPRICTKSYEIPNTDIVIQKGTSVLIPAWGLHMDPEYYPNPEVFDPERFSEENKCKRPDYTWLPFGEGPRICIGKRFGLLQSKVGIVTFLKNFTITLNKKTKNPMTFDKFSGITAADGGVWVDCEKIKQDN